jgi:hypothetical protein
MGSNVLTAVPVKITVLWEVTSCSLVETKLNGVTSYKTIIFKNSIFRWLIDRGLNSRAYSSVNFTVHSHLEPC